MLNLPSQSVKRGRDVCGRSNTSASARTFSKQCGRQPRRKPMPRQSVKPKEGPAPSTLKLTCKVEPLTCAIGAEVRDFDLGAASRDPGLLAEIRALLLQHK